MPRLSQAGTGWQPRVDLEEHLGRVEQGALGGGRDQGLEVGQRLDAARGEVAQVVDRGLGAGGLVVGDQQLGGLGGLVGEGAAASRRPPRRRASPSRVSCVDLVEAAGGVGEDRAALGLVADAEAGLGVLDGALERVEDVTGQRALGGHGHRRGGTDDREPTEGDGEAALARACAGADGEAVGRASARRVGRPVRSRRPASAGRAGRRRTRRGPRRAGRSAARRRAPGARRRACRSTPCSPWSKESNRSALRRAGCRLLIAVSLSVRVGAVSP